MRHLLIGTLVGLVLGLLLAGNVATAQAPTRAYAVDATTGATVPVRATGGALYVNLR